MGAPADLSIDSPTVPPTQNPAARPRLERARSSSLGALTAPKEPPQALPPAVPHQDDLARHSHSGDRPDGSAVPSIGLGLSGIEAEHRSTLDYGLTSSLPSSESSSPNFASTSSLATPLYYTPPFYSDVPSSSADNAFATSPPASEPSPTVAAPNPSSPNIPNSPTPTLHITSNPTAPPLNSLPPSARNLAPNLDRRGSLTLEERLSNLELSPPRLALVGEDAGGETSPRGVLPLPRVSESSSSSAELDQMEGPERQPKGAEQGINIAHARLVDAVQPKLGDSTSSSVASSTLPIAQASSLRPSPSLGASPSNPLPARPERSPSRSSAKSPQPSIRSPSLLASPPQLSHSSSSPSLRSPSTTHLSPSKSTSRSDKRSSILSFVGFGSLGRKRGSILPPPVASPPKMTRSPSTHSYEFGSSHSTLDGVQETDLDDCSKEEDDFIAVEALPSRPRPLAPAAEVRLINSKAAVLLGLENPPVSPPRSAPMSTSTSQDSTRSARSKLQRVGSAAREEREKERRVASSGSDATTLHTYEHDPLPPFPCTLGEVLEHELASEALYRHAPVEHHHTSFLRSHHRPSSKDWRPQQLYLTSFPSPLSEPPTSIPSLHLFKIPAARNDREIARLELTRDSIVCVPPPEDERLLALGGSGKVNHALKITGVAPRELDERGKPVEGERKQTSWIVGMEKPEQMARWLKVLKAAVRDLQDTPKEVSPPASITRSPSVGTRETERQRRDRESSWQSNASGKSSTASMASSMVFDSGPKMTRRPSATSQTPSTTNSLSPPPATRRSPSSRRGSDAVSSLDDDDPFARAPPSHLYINAQLPSLPSAFTDGAEDEDDPDTAHPYRMAEPTPVPRLSSHDSRSSKRLSVLSSPPRARPSEDSTSTSPSHTSSDPPRRPNRDSTSLSSISSRTTSSSYKHPPRPPPPMFGLPPPPHGLPRSLPLPLPRAQSDPTASRAEKRLSVMSTSTNASSTSSSSLRSRLSGAPLPPQLPPPPSTNLPLPPPPVGETPYKGLSAPPRVQRASTESILEDNEGGDEVLETRRDGRASSRGPRSAPPDFAMGALPPPPPPPSFAMGALPRLPGPTTAMMDKARGGSVRGRVQQWEGQ